MLSGCAFTVEPLDSDTPELPDWDYIKQVVESVEVPVVANGDVVDSASAAKCLEKTNASGLMIGRGAIGRPAMFGYLKVGLGWMEEAALPWVKLHDDWQEMDETQQALPPENGAGTAIFSCPKTRLEYNHAGCNVTL